MKQIGVKISKEGPKIQVTHGSIPLWPFFAKVCSDIFHAVCSYLHEMASCCRLADMPRGGLDLKDTGPVLYIPNFFFAFDSGKRSWISCSTTFNIMRSLSPYLKLINILKLNSIVASIYLSF